MPIVYAVIICIVMNIAGTVPGLVMEVKFREWTRRPSITPTFLLFLLIFSSVANPSISVAVLIQKAADNINIWKLTPYCPA